MPLERLFNSNDVYKKVSNKGENQDTLDYNIGTDVHSKFVKISSKLEEKQNLDCVQLFKEFVDVFAWSYEDLKTYDQGIIHHKIPVQENTKLVR